MKLLVSGSTGLIGSSLVPCLVKKGYAVSRLLRNPKQTGSGDLIWDPGAGELDHEQLSGFQAIIHLSGENLSRWIWTKSQKKKIMRSRVDSTKLLAEAISRLPDPKPALICASAAHYYGDRGQEYLNEESRPGEGFLAGVVKAWEQAADDARSAGVRVVHLRSGVILSRNGGFLKRVLPVFNLGLGGKLGNGVQFLPWISLPDVMEIVDFCLQHQDIEGPVNVVAPQEITNGQFTEQLARKLSRPSFFTVPETLLKFVLGEMAEELLLSSIRMKPDVLLKNGFTFNHPTLQTALESILEEKKV